jgi:GNAT superfamily N-acetyltransferase
MPTIKFTLISDHQPGTILSLLRESYAPIWNPRMEANYRQVDRDTFANPAITACSFITCLDDQPIGFAGYDPRPAPELAIIGHNCIIPQFRRRGFGRQQIGEILHRLQGLRIQKVVVTTSDHPFFVPAQKMYLACGFKESRRFYESLDSESLTIEYQLDL